MGSLISRMDVIPIVAPRKEPVRSGMNAGEPVTASEFGIVRIETEDGGEGLGEVSITYPRIGHTLCEATARLVAPALMKKDARQMTLRLREVDRILGGELSAPYIRAAIEMALLDWNARQAGVPVSQWLGGKVRNRIGLAWGIYQKAAGEMALDARRACAEGFQAIKLKVGRRLEEDLEAVQAVAAVVGDMPLRLDANGAWNSVSEAAQAIEALAKVARIAWVEQPLPRRNLDGLRLLRQRTGVAVMADESCQTLRDAYELARAEAADLWNVYVVEAGGVMAAAQILALGEAVGVPCILGSQAEMGIGTAACAQLAAATGWLPYAIETFGPLRYARDVVKRGVVIENGYLMPPDGPGLGVELDSEAVEEMRLKV